MKRHLPLLIVCLMLALTGCQGNSLQSQGEGAGASGGLRSGKSSSPAVGEQPPVTAPQTTPAPADDTPQPTESPDVVEITETLFVSQLNNIYLNPDEYIGETMKYEGMFAQYHSDETDMTYYLVYRKSPGCCGTDGQAGFEVIWPEGSHKTYPAENDWCEVVGTLASYDEDGQRYLHIVLASLTVLDKRGAEFVSQ